MNQFDDISSLIIKTDICITAELTNNLTEQSNKLYAVHQGDEITYTITLSNLSQADLHDVTVFTIISSETILKPNTVSPPAKSDESLLSGIDLGDLPAQTYKTLTFNVSVNNDATADIITTAYTNFKFYDEYQKEHSQTTKHESNIISIEKSSICPSECICRPICHNMYIPNLKCVTDCNVYLVGGNCLHFSDEQIIKIVYGITLGYLDYDECVKSIVTEAAVMFFNPPCNTSICNWTPRISYPACIDTHGEDVTVSFKVYICK